MELTGHCIVSEATCLGFSQWKPWKHIFDPWGARMTICIYAKTSPKALLDETISRQHCDRHGPEYTGLQLTNLSSWWDWCSVHYSYVFIFLYLIDWSPMKGTVWLVRTSSLLSLWTSDNSFCLVFFLFIKSSMTQYFFPLGDDMTQKSSRTLWIFFFWRKSQEKYST